MNTSASTKIKTSASEPSDSPTEGLAESIKKGANIWPVKNPVGQPLTTNVVIEGEKYRSRVCGEGITERDVFFNNLYTFFFADGNALRLQLLQVELAIRQCRSSAHMKLNSMPYPPRQGSLPRFNS